MRCIIKVYLFEDRKDVIWISINKYFFLTTAFKKERSISKNNQTILLIYFYLYADTYWLLLTITDIYWHLLTFADTYWLLPKLPDTYWLLLILPDIYWHLLTFTDNLLTTYWQLTDTYLHLLTRTDNYWLINNTEI